tara:strand:+ start:1221 stop:1391 length:171 start_codon:yes stop_codon:yes gene_type:complete
MTKYFKKVIDILKKEDELTKKDIEDIRRFYGLFSLDEMDEIQYIEEIISIQQVKLP